MSVLDAIAKQYEKSKSGGSSGGSYEQDFSKYFAVRLEEGVDSGELTVPLCEVSEELFKSWKETGNKTDKELATQYSARKFYLARLISRDNEGDGIKFWRFPHNYKGEGALDKMIPLFTKRGDITDPREGRDITLMVGRDNKGYAKITSILTEDVDILTDPKSPKAKEWMGDMTSWKEVYKAQPLDYVQLIADGETPQWDKNLEKFVAKGDDSSDSQSSFKSVPKKEEKTVTTESKSNDSDDDEQPF